MHKSNVGLFIGVWVIILVGAVGCETKNQIMSQLGLKEKTTTEKDFRDRAETLLDEDDTEKSFFSNKKKDKVAAGDDAFIEGSLREQLKHLKKQRAEQATKASEYMNKAEELTHQASECQTRLSETEKRIAKLKKVMNALDDNSLQLEDAVNGPSYEDYAEVEGGTLLEEADTSALFSSGGPFASPNAGSNMAAIAPVQVDPTEGWTNASDSNQIAEPPVQASPSVPGIESMLTKPASTIPQGGASVSIIALDGKGADAVALLGKGQADGVKKGALFSHVDSQGKRTILQVTDVYPTSSRAIPHPLYNEGDVQMNDTAVQVGGLPE